MFILCLKIIIRLLLDVLLTANRFEKIYQNFDYVFEFLMKSVTVKKYHVQSQSLNVFDEIFLKYIRLMFKTIMIYSTTVTVEVFKPIFLQVEIKKSSL